MPINICYSGRIKSKSTKFVLANKTNIRQYYKFASVKMQKAKSYSQMCGVSASASFSANADNIQNIHKQYKSKFDFIIIPLYKKEKRFQTLQILKSHVPLLSCLK